MSEQKGQFPRGGITPAKYVKTRGLESLQQLSEETTVAVSTLRDWFVHKPRFFDIVISGVLFDLTRMRYA